MKSVVVTGASGFVGRSVVRRLAALGWRVTALVRRDEEVPGASRHARVDDLDDLDALRVALAGARAVIHLAARVHVMRETATDSLAAFRAVNVDGTRHVRDLAVKAGVQRLVYLSSVKVHGAGRRTPYHAEDALAPEDPYGVSKQEAEGLLHQISGERLGWTILRPPLVYGPQVRGNFRRLLRLAELASKVPLPLGGIANRRSLLYVENLADAIAAVLATEAAIGRTYLLSDGEDLSTSELLEHLAAGLGRRAHLLPCPTRLATAFARVLDRSGEAQRLLGSLTVDSSPLHRETGWKAPHAVDAALCVTAEWWRALRNP